ncbi:helix-turn-helix domain-containing protein [Streptomyces orinoci]|uniref:Helix-turn-helix transcriptional regulator n=1 Tax=Streptomyces orinoci TaxID=67339 RepID=A0ABV3K0N1_STRON|nr:helix-turn-helix transcriptional regulator [Streptomyces orinoci]
MAGRKRGELQGTGAQAELAMRLRDLRDASDLTLRQLAARSGFSTASLSVAESGRRTPSWAVIEAFVGACGADAAQWRQLWEVAAQSASAGKEATTTPPAASAVEDVHAAGVRPYRRLLKRRGVLSLVALFVVVCVSTLGWVLIGSSGHAPAPDESAAPSRSGLPIAARPAHDDTDPYHEGCNTDQKQLDWQPVNRADGSPFGTLQLRASKACQAAWGYLAGPNSKAWTIHITVHRTPGNISIPWHFSGDTQPGSWSNVLSTRKGCVWVEAYVVDTHGEGPHARTACFQAP